MKLAKELLLIPIVLLIFTFLISNAYGFVYGKIAYVFLPTNDSYLQISKIYITGVLCFMLIEYFAMSFVPNNYFFSRMLGMITMLSLYIIISYYYYVTFFVHISIILCGCLVSYIVQKMNEIRLQNFIGLFLLIIVFSYLTVVSF